jgi:transposase
MMGVHVEQKNLFTYGINLDQRVRKDNPLRQIAERIDFSFVRDEVRQLYGRNGNESVDPEIILKLMFLLFLDNVKSERELMRMIPERLDYLWFLGYGLDDEVPNHSVLSKARNRWGRDTFEQFFIRSVQQCVETGLVGGEKIHVDGSVIAADASQGSVVRAGPELIADLKRLYSVEEQKLESARDYKYYARKNKRLLSLTDPDAPVVRHSKQGCDGVSRPRYKHHRSVDDDYGVITAQTTTPGDIEENVQLEPLIDQHETNVGQPLKTAIGDKQYGTIENYRQLQKRGINTHMDHGNPGNRKALAAIYPLTDFIYQHEADTYICPSGQVLYRRRHDPIRKSTEYKARKGVCAQCAVRDQCTRAKYGRTVTRHDCQELVTKGRAQAKSRAAKTDRRRRRILIEGSFGQAATNHHFKRSRWRRLWRQQIQDDLIAAIQNIKILIKYAQPKPAQTRSGHLGAVCLHLIGLKGGLFRPITAHCRASLKLIGELRQRVSFIDAISNFKPFGQQLRYVYS